jgi:16S rRNA (guanine1207-N2)-methyltransferase
MNFIPTAAYTQVQQCTVKLGQQQLAHITKPGLPSWATVFPSSQLFISNAIFQPGARLLLFGCHLGTLAAFLARAHPSLELGITDHSHTALEMARLTLEANRLSSIDILDSVELPERMYGKFHIIYIQLPKGRQLARRWLMQAYYGLAEDGSLYLAGANGAGIQSVIKDAQVLFGNGRVLAYKKGNRVAQFIKRPENIPEIEWAHSPGIYPGSWVEFTTMLCNHNFIIRSLPGVFSYDKLDEGTKMLVEAAEAAGAANVLDMGCGYGVIGLVASAQGAGTVHMVDNDLLAIAACVETLSVNGVTKAQVFAGDLLAPVLFNKYDLILSNPPFHAGQAVNYQIASAMIGQSFQALAPSGKLVIVANRFIRYDQLIESVFGNVSTLAESGKFHVLCGLKSSL